MKYHIIHTTEYKYHQSVSLCHNVARLLPRNTETQHLQKSAIRISPKPEVIEEYEDFYGNRVFYFSVQQEHSSLKVSVLTEIERKDTTLTIPGLYQDLPWDNIPSVIEKEGETSFEIRQFIAPTALTEATAEIAAYAEISFWPGRSCLEGAMDLVKRIYNEFEFDPSFSSIVTPLSEVMKAKKGVCQDFAHLGIACLRSMGIPARYVSGYIETIPPTGKEKLAGVDASHAWFSIYLPHVGWVDLDPTNNMKASDQHITIGWGRDYADVPPLKGVILSAGPHQLNVSVDVRRIS